VAAGRSIEEWWTMNGEGRTLDTDTLALRPRPPLPAPRRGVPGELVGVSTAMRELLAQTEVVAGTDLPVLLEGEPGAGKGLVARTLHRLGPRAGRPFVIVDCSCLQGESFEAELFGQSPEGLAHDHREGLAGAADGGTLFFDEVADLGPDSQAKLVRFVDSRLVRPLGPARPRPVDVRLLCATRRDLRSEVRAGRFRADLYYRLRGILLRIPSLRDRREDLPLLVEHLLTGLGARFDKRVRMSAAGLASLLTHPWEGNVRELASALERGILRTPAGGEIAPEALALRTLGPAPEPAAEGGLRGYRHEQERAIVVEALERTRWNVSAAARQLGLSRVGLSKKIKTLGLSRPAPGGRRV
jgi:DNA-binding NtrC family response regulator